MGEYKDSGLLDLDLTDEETLLSYRGGNTPEGESFDLEKIVTKTKKGIRVKLKNGSELWLPKSMVFIKDKEIWIEQWLVVRIHSQLIIGR